MTFDLGRDFNPVNFGWQTVCWWCGLELLSSETESLIPAQGPVIHGPPQFTGGL